MAASTIGRSTWTDGAAGTTISNARLQADVYDKVDALVAAAITFGSTVSAEGFGTHSFSSGGTGGNIFKLRNSTAGTTNYCQFQLDNDGGNIGALLATSSTYTTVGDVIASAMALRSAGSGGVVLTASHASGGLKIYTGGTTERARIPSSGNLLLSSQGSFPATNTGAGLIISSTSPSIDLYETDGGADAKWWRWIANSGVLTLTVLDDATSGAGNVITVTRSGTTISNMTLGTVLLGVDGTVGGPGHSFTSEPTSGLYRGTAGHIAIAALGKEVIDFNQSFFSSGAPCALLVDTAVGTGAKSGTVLSIGRNSSGSGAAGCLRLLDRAAGEWYIWSDAGTLRINGGSFPLENDSTVAHTGGTVIGTQTSSRDSKIVLGAFDQTASALDLVRRIPLYRWRYRQGSQALRDEEFVGVITDETPEFGMDRDDAHPGGKSLNVPSAIGYLIAAVQEQQRMIEQMQGAAA